MALLSAPEVYVCSHLVKELFLVGVRELSDGLAQRLAEAHEVRPAEMHSYERAGVRSGIRDRHSGKSTAQEGKGEKRNIYIYIQNNTKYKKKYKIYTDASKVLGFRT